MRRGREWLGLGMSLALTTVILARGPESSAAEQVKKESVGDGPAYKALGEWPLMHQGRVKPIDTVAREEIKAIYTRETIKLPLDGGKTLASWGPVAAFFDWSVRPKFWDAQPIIAVEWLPLKRFILRGEIRTALDAIAGKASVAADDRARIQAVMAREEIDAAALRGLVRGGQLAEADAKVVEALAAKVGEETKWLSPDDLEDAEVTVEGKVIPFVQWLDELTNRGRRAGGMSSGRPKLSELEQKAFEVGGRLASYRAIRDRETMSNVPLLVAPHPSSPATLKYAAEVYAKAEEQGPRSLAPLELDAANTLHNYLNDLPNKDRALPGTDPGFDARYTAWLKEKSAWVPLGVIRDVAIEDLAKAGFPAPKVEAFRAALKKMADEELANPGRAGLTPALALVDAARDLGRAINPDAYPSPEAMKREAHFNDFAPFFQAPKAYGLAVLALIFSLVATNFGASMAMSGVFGKVSRGLYLAGIVAFIAGIGYEAYGFYLRVAISGWSPVTNMYETVIWVSMMLSVLGFAIEAIHRKTYAALAGALVALLGTGLAATVPMLDPKIPQLPPVLRNNFWLAVHVLTIVSSYAAFALAWGLGLIASAAYLVATYRRSSSFARLAAPIVPGLPMLAGGWYGVNHFFATAGTPSLFQSYGFWPSLAVASLGGVAVAGGLFAILGELVNRAIFREAPSLDDAALAGSDAESGPAYREAPIVHPGGVAVLEAVGVVAAPMARPKADARTLAMQATAAQVKPMANFIYRSMQVGILLVASGTFLGGWWADVSWGRFWGWDPKEVWALITLLVYLIPLHGRFAGWVNTFWLVMASVACFCSVLMAWYGVNFVLGVGLHSYGSGEGGQKPVLIATVVMLGFAAGAFWRRRESSRVPTLSA